MTESPGISLSTPVIRTRPVTVRVLGVGALLALTGGWLLGAAVQGPGFSSVTGTISALAATTAHHRGVMNAGLAAAAFCLLGLGYAGRTLTAASRCLLGVAGLGLLLIVAAPLPDYGRVHTYAAWLTFLSLSLWPAAGFRLGRTRWRRGVGATVVVLVNMILLIWTEFFPAQDIGIAERGLATVSLTAVAVQMVRGRTTDR